MTDLGKIPPQDIDLEAAVLGALVLERDAILKIDLIPEVFYKQEHQEIFRAVIAINERGGNIDLLTVAKHLRDTGKIESIGGPGYLAQLTRNVASAANIEQHAKFLLQSYFRREIIRLSSEMGSMAYDQSNDIEEILAVYDSTVSQIDAVIAGKRKGREIIAVMKDLSREVERRCTLASKGGIVGVPTGFTELNKLTAGWQPGNMIVFAARPAMGKTAIGVNGFAKAAAQSGKWVNIFSLEMEDIRLVERLVLGSSNIDPEAMRSGKMTADDWDKFNAASSELAALPIFIDDTPFAKISRIRNIARANRKAGKCDLILIDYLQLANADGNIKQNREQQVADMSRQLKAVARELDVPLILLSQLSRDVEKRGGTKRPTLSDLRESGAIEQDADMVIFPWRPAYYGINAEVKDPDNYGELIIAKNRHGGLAAIKFWHDGNMTSFREMATEGDDYYNPF